MNRFIKLGLAICSLYIFGCLFYHFWINHPNRAFLELNLFVILSGIDIRRL